MMNRRGQMRLGALIAAGLALGGASAHAETVTEDHHTIAVTSNETNVYGGRILVQEAQEGFGTYRANGNSITVSAQGSQEGELYAATIEQRAAQTGTTFTAEANGNTVTVNGGSVNGATAARIALTTNAVGTATATADNNDVIGTGGRYAWITQGGTSMVTAANTAATATVTNNDISITNGTLGEGFSAVGGSARAIINYWGRADAAANNNTVTLRSNTGEINGSLIGGSAYADPIGTTGSATANENAVTVEGGSYEDGRSVTGGTARAQAA